MIIATDFDGTLCEHAYPKIGTPYDWIINKLIQFRKKGHKIILWTCRDGIKLKEAIEWCKKFGLEFDAINEDLPEIKKDFTYKSQKVYADFYLDDRNISFDNFVNIRLEN